MLRFLLNVLWFVLGGFVMGLGWWLAGVVAAITIVGLPWASACFRIASFSFWPFGREAINRRDLTAAPTWPTAPWACWATWCGFWWRAGGWPSAT